MSAMYTNKVVQTLGLAASLCLFAPAAHANYISGYSGGGNYMSGYGGGSSLTLSNYGGGGYSPGGSGYSVVNFGYTSGGWTQSPHRATWAEYTRLRTQYDAQTYSAPPCGAYHRNPTYCRQQTTRWSPWLAQ